MMTFPSKYLLFAGHNYYPDGGVRDLVASADTVEELQQYFIDHAEEIAQSYINNWGQIVEHSSMEVVLSGQVRSVNGHFSVPGEVRWFKEKDRD